MILLGWEIGAIVTQKQKPKFETAQEEFGRRVRELYALAQKMNLRLTIMVRRSNEGIQVKPERARPESAKSGRREPGED